MLKKLKLLMLTATLSTILLSSTNVFAKGINFNDNVSPTKSIEVSELPNGVIPMHFNSEEQANLYFDKVVENLENSKTEDVTSDISFYDYRGSRYVQKRVWPVIVTMEVPYLAKWNSKWGNYYASASKPETGIAGNTLGFEWRPISASTYSNIGSNPTTLTAHGAGYLDLYFIVEGGIKVRTDRISISGSWGQP